ncbi:MAG: hypothetical protein D6718_06325 [Acidobacteria bacterium]|nr:MAG: hypothetical protein D6718_06325 [Acidobacteriota bacterium]
MHRAPGRTRLRAIRGGLDRRPTVLDAVADYAAERGLPESDEERVAVEVALELIARFFELGRPSRSRGGEDPAAGRVEAERLVPALGPCVRLFPYANIVRASWILAFGREALSLARYCRRRGWCDAEALRRFEAVLRGAGATLRRFHALQQAIERFPAPPVLAGEEEDLFEGRYRILGLGADGAALAAGEGVVVAPVRLPAPARPLFKTGRYVSMLITEGRGGWWPLATTLPAPPSLADRLLSRAEAALAREGERG